MTQKKQKMTIDVYKRQTMESDGELQKYIKSLRPSEKLAPHLLLSPLKREIYEENCKLNDGFYNCLLYTSRCV